MSKVDPVTLHKLSIAVLAALRRAGRLPTRLDEEDYEDLVQEGVLAALSAMGNYDATRGSVGTYLSKPIQRAQLREAWKLASIGITGDHRGIQVWSMDDNGEHEDDGVPEHIQNQLPAVDDIAEEIEAFDYVWKTHYLRD